MILNGTVHDLAVAWDNWREAIPEDERELVAQIVMDADFETRAGINRFSSQVIKNMFSGRLSPAVALAAKPWIELIMVNIHEMHAAAGTSGQAGGDVFAALVEIAKSRQIQPVYRQIAVAPDLGEVLPPEPVAITAEPQKAQSQKVKGG